MGELWIANTTTPDMESAGKDTELLLHQLFSITGGRDLGEVGEIMVQHNCKVKVTK